MKNSKIKKIIRKIFIYGIRVLLVAIVVYNIVYTIGKEYNTKFNIKICGKQSFIVTEQSMEPELKIDDVIITKKTAEIEIGDIVAFYQNNDLRIRRIQSISNEQNKIRYITKGDNCLYMDFDEITSERIEGKVIKVLKKQGGIYKIIQSKGLMIFNTIFLIVVFLYNLRIKKRKVKRKVIKEKQNLKK